MEFTWVLVSKVSESSIPVDDKASSKGQDE